MDTDDIAREDRFEKQLQIFMENQDLDICGSYIIEFEGDIDDVLSKRVVPITHNDIAEYQKQRSAFNHMTVMYKKSTVLRAGNYEHCPLMEDDMLWIRMLIAGANCANVDDYLVYARTGYAMSVVVDGHILKSIRTEERRFLIQDISVNGTIIKQLVYSFLLL